MNSVHEEWDKVIRWFDSVKTKTGTDIPDNFIILNEQVSIEGENLSKFMDNFADKYGHYEKEELHNEFDLSNIGTRTQLKTHLLNSLYEIKE